VLSSELLPCLELNEQAVPWRTAQLIEYNGLGDVERYGHQVDSFNNTYRALRVISNTSTLLIECYRYLADLLTLLTHASQPAGG
jgi:hypothetical protein